MLCDNCLCGEQYLRQTTGPNAERVTYHSILVSGVAGAVVTRHQVQLNQCSTMCFTFPIWPHSALLHRERMGLTIDMASGAQFESNAYCLRDALHATYTHTNYSMMSNEVKRDGAWLPPFVRNKNTLVTFTERLWMICVEPVFGCCFGLGMLYFSYRFNWTSCVFSTLRRRIWVSRKEYLHVLTLAPPWQYNMRVPPEEHTTAAAMSLIRATRIANHISFLSCVARLLLCAVVA